MIDLWNLNDIKTNTAHSQVLPKELTNNIIIKKIKINGRVGKNKGKFAMTPDGFEYTSSKIIERLANKKNEN